MHIYVASRAREGAYMHICAVKDPGAERGACVAGGFGTPRGRPRASRASAGSGRSPHRSRGRIQVAVIHDQIAATTDAASLVCLGGSTLEPPLGPSPFG